MITETMMVFASGLATGSVFTLFTMFLIGLLYRLDCVHLCSDEVDFDFEKSADV